MIEIIINKRFSNIPSVLIKEANGNLNLKSIGYNNGHPCFVIISNIICRQYP